MENRGKNINLFLIDGNVNGRIKCTLANWTGLAFKIPRTGLEESRDRSELKQTGVYFLFGKDDQTDQNVVYIGQAGVRKNGEGILYRLFEHNRNNNKDYWTEAVALTTSNDSMGPTEISYLEHRFCQLAKEANRYVVKNGNDPTSGNVTEEKQSELEDFIEYAQMVIGVLGHRLFVPLVEKVKTNSPELICTRSGANARAVITSDGFVVKKGSLIVDHLTKSCPSFVKKKREQLKDLIKNYVLQEDILFNSPSGASCFVTGSSSYGYVEWKTKDGKPLKELEI